MNSKFSASLFDALKTTLQEQRTGGSFKDIMKTEVGGTYRVRLIPNINDIRKTNYHYYSHGWKSLATGNFISCVCPTTAGQRCAICEERIRLYRGDAKDKDNAKLLNRKEQWLINVYVIEDPTTTENNGSVKILRYGKQLDTIINEAIDGEDSEEFGMRIFDLSENGCDLRIKVDKNEGGYPTYTKSKFLRESKIDNMTEAKINQIYENLYDLTSVYDAKSPEEVKTLLETHFHCNVVEQTSGAPASNDSEDAEKSTDSGSVVSGTEKEMDAKLQDLIKDL